MDHPDFIACRKLHWSEKGYAQFVIRQKRNMCVVLRVFPLPFENGVNLLIYE